MQKKYLSELEGKLKIIQERLQELKTKFLEYKDASMQLSANTLLLSKKLEEFEKEKNVSRNFYKEKYKGFPSIANAYNEYIFYQDLKEIKYFDFKIRPAKSTAEKVSEINRERRKYFKESLILKRKLDACLEYAPDLEDILDNEFNDDDFEYSDSPYTDEEKEDAVSKYMTIEEYRKLSVSERNQLALDRFKQRRKDSKGIGTFYERYIGHIYESQGYEVTYNGILKGKEDRGVDIIACKGKDMLIIQCKNWSKYKTIFENSIFQLYGSSHFFEMQHPNKKIHTIFFATTKIDDFAKQFSKKVGIEIFDSHQIDYDYPMIKCNISMINGEKIYHLPMDQQYDNIKINLKKGETFCKTIADAEKLGFRRAFKWTGKK